MDGNSLKLGPILLTCLPHGRAVIEDCDGALVYLEVDDALKLATMLTNHAFPHQKTGRK